MALLQLVPYNTKINFIGFRHITFALAMIVFFLSGFGYFTKGLNFGIDFQGGYIFELKTKESQNLTELRTSFDGLKLGDVSIQEFGSDQDLLIRVEKNDTLEQEEVIEKVKSLFPEDTDYRRVETVGPKVGEELIGNAIKALALALSAMLIYIGIRFEWQFAACAVVALAHDCAAIFLLFCFFPFEFNETSIIAILITAGYSINDSIVIFDRIRENMRHFKKMEMKELINKSINDTLSRTMLTATTTLMALFALYLFGGKVIAAFSFPIIIGIIVGSFSSICLAAPLLLFLNLKRPDEEPSLEQSAVNRA
jgi:preprotein translocase SecF subunit